jgi:predicted dehydrogenase
MIQRRAIQGNGESTVYVGSAQGEAEEPLKAELRSFIHSIRAGTPPVVSGDDGLAALELAHQVLGAIGVFIQRREDSAPSSVLTL